MTRTEQLSYIKKFLDDLNIPYSSKYSNFISGTFIIELLDSDVFLAVYTLLEKAAIAKKVMLENTKDLLSESGSDVRYVSVQEVPRIILTLAAYFDEDTYSLSAVVDEEVDFNNTDDKEDENGL